MDCYHFRDHILRKPHHGQHIYGACLRMYFPLFRDTELKILVEFSQFLLDTHLVIPMDTTLEYNMVAFFWSALVCQSMISCLATTMHQDVLRMLVYSET